MLTGGNRCALLARAALGCVVALLACTDGSSDGAKVDVGMTPYDSIAALTRSIDDLASSSHPSEFNLPSRSTEGSAGRLYRFADSSARIDIDDFGEMGKNRTRFYAQGPELRLAVSVQETYNRPMSGVVTKTTVDSTWFAADTAIRWLDSLGVMHVHRDSVVRAHGQEMLAEYRRSIRMAEAKPLNPR
jgi:hypothetical protein